MTLFESDFNSGNRGVIELHASEAAFLWLNYCVATSAPHHTLKTLTKLSQRVEGHLDGLRVAGETGWQVICDEMRWKESGEFFVAACIAVGNPEPARWPFVIEQLTDVSEGAAGVTSALGWQEYPVVGECIESLVSATNPIYRRVALAAGALHSRDAGGALVNFASDPDQAIRALAVKAIGELGHVDLMQNCLNSFSDDDLNIQLQAANAAALLGCGQRATFLLQQLAEAGLSDSEQAAMMAARAMPLREANVWQDQLTGEANPRLPIIVAGATGDPKHLPWLVEQMESQPVARLAGEAFSMITGADLAYLDLDMKPPKDFEAGPTEDPADENVAMDADEHLPWPNPKKIRKWCATHARNLRPGVRHLLGKPIEPNSLQHALRHGYQRQRAAAAIELSLARPGTPLFNVKAPAFRQKKLLGL